MVNFKSPIAVIDVGAHFARLEIVQASSKGKKYETLEKLSNVAPLGIDVFTRGKISTQNTFLIGKILKDYSAVIKEYDVKYIKAVATSAVREASNSDIFIERVEKLSGIRLQELDSTLESRLLFMAIKNSFMQSPLFTEKNALICSVGTGATLVSFVEKGILKSSENTRLGSLRLLEELERPLANIHLKEVIKPFVESSAKDMLAHSTVNFKNGIMIGVGSSVRALLRLSDKMQLDENGMRFIDIANFDDLYLQISEMKTDEIAGKLGISDTLAQSIEPCCAILYHFFHASNAEKIIIPDISTRDAIVSDFIRELKNEHDPFTPYIISSVKSFGEKFFYDPKHASMVASMSMHIFENTHFLHGLNEKDALLLSVAAYLHDIGLYVSSRKHHKHSYYLIRNAHIPGISSKDIEIISLIARYHRGGFPKNTHSEYQILGSEDKVKVNALAAILRIADSLDFIHKFEIAKIKFDHRKKVMEIILDGIVDAVLENWAAKQKANLFKEVFGYKVRITGR
ncbi:MAG TPA: hypothetical protein DD381_13405 [Lentisphaeria bacterium]|nr:MAG: hypothetical protein A2X47_09875 [Lentisphaerae bacterium GWF2_38_69]HBM17318.1 hypothetical protein [Lentisphaeria bacterium]